MKSIKTSALSLVTLILCFGLLSCNGDKDTQTPQNDQYDKWQTFNQGNYSIRYPADWTLNTNGIMGAKFFLLAAMESESDKFRENINLAIEPFSAGLDEYIDVGIGIASNFLSDYKVVSREKVNDASGEHSVMVMTFSQGGQSLKTEQHIWIYNGNAYILTFTSSPDSFDRYRDVAGKILASFTLK
ncbi:MAG: DUF1795 domain-containing protein [Azoarcus sp.]|jgi:hypothetical protein|nr:DUF1795 domain-containing protein [Azoarcus sp.]